MKFLVMGDPHMRVQDLEEGERLIERTLAVIDETKADRFVVMGDLFHYHDMVQVEVLTFWRNALTRIASRVPVIVILGNHDAPHHMPKGSHAFQGLHGIRDVTIIDEPTMMMFVDGEIGAADGYFDLLFVPFMRESQDFINVCHLYSNAKIAYCHQEFNGAMYDNGFYAKHGVLPEQIPQTLVISGHIHTQQEFDKVWYVGAPRWMTVSDANQDRCLWLIEHDNKTGAVIARSPYATDPACQRIVKLDDSPDSPVDIKKIDAAWKVVVDIRGPAAWVEERKAIWRGKARVRTFVEGEKKVVVRESDGIPTAFRKYAGAYEPRFGTPKDRLEKMVNERIQFA